MSEFLDVFQPLKFVKMALGAEWQAWDDSGFPRRSLVIGGVVWTGRR